MAKQKKSPDNNQDESFFTDIARRFKEKPFIYTGSILILIIIIIAFVFLPAIVPGEMGAMDLNFGYYNRIPINYVEGNYFHQMQMNLARQYQVQLDSNYHETLFRIWHEAFQATVVQIAILDEMKRAGYTPPDDVVDMYMAMLPQFQENGRFSVARFRQLDSNRRMTLWRQIRDSIAVDQYMSAMTGLSVSSREAAHISAMASPQRTFDMVSFSINIFPNSEVENYVRSNPDLFRITHLYMITAGSEREARQILTSIQNGTETFENAARNMSIDRYGDNSGDMGSRMVFEILLDIPNEQARSEILGLSRGQLSNVLRIQDNTWSIFRVEENVRQADISDQTALERIRNYMMLYQRGIVEDWVISQAENFISDARLMDFDTAAVNIGMSKRTFGPIPLNYGDNGLFSSVSGSGIPELNIASTNERFWQIAFSTPI